jgi:hypothetical protein
MDQFYARSRSRRSWLVVLGVLCVALLLTSSIVQVAHNHPSGQPDHDCSLCVSAHNVIQIAPTVHLALSSLPLAAVAAEPALALPRRYFFYTLWSRPPPADPAFA